LTALEAVGFNLVGYGCTTCIGNSGPLPDPVSQAVKDGELVVSAVLSGNRNFEGRVNPQVKANYLASPPLVVAYALAGTVERDLTTEPIGEGKDGKPVMLSEIWPTQAEVNAAISQFLKPEQFSAEYSDVFRGDDIWRALPSPEGEKFSWDDASTYVRHPPYFVTMKKEPGTLAEAGSIKGARVLCMLGDSVTTDHISPAGNIAKDSPAARYLVEHGVQTKDFNQYGARRGNDEVMVRGTFANIRLKNLLAPGTEGGVTAHLPDRTVMSIFDASVKYRAAGTPLIVLAGKEYGTGSSRDWAAKGPALLGVRAVLAESFERIHRSNLVGMGILPLEYLPGQDRLLCGLTGFETYEVVGTDKGLAPGGQLTLRATSDDGAVREVPVRVRIDTPLELEYYRHGGILQYVLRQLMA
jgi:aconitate hydratase